MGIFRRGGWGLEGGRGVQRRWKEGAGKRERDSALLLHPGDIICGTRDASVGPPTELTRV